MKENRIETAQELLNEKYGEKFTVYSYGKSFGTLTNNTYTVICSPADEPALRFEAEIAKDGSYIYDEYVSRKVSDKIEKAMMKVLSVSNTQMAVKVGAATKIIDSVQADMPVKEFMALTPNAKFAIYVVLDQEKLTKQEASETVELLKKSIAATPSINGYVYLYLGTEEMVSQFSKYIRENPGADKGLFDILKSAKSLEAVITQSDFNIDKGKLLS